MALFGSKKSRSEKILEDVDEYIRTGNELLKKGDIEGANSSFRKARILLMKFDTSDMPLETAKRYTKIAYGIMETGDDEIAMECADLALELNKKEVDAYLVKGAIYLKRTRMYNQAILSFNDALKINPKHEKALELKAGALEKRKDYKKAYMIYKQLVETSDNPDKYRKKMDAIKKRLKLRRAGQRASGEKKEVKISMEHPPAEKKVKAEEQRVTKAEELKPAEAPEPALEAPSKAEATAAEGEMPEEAVAEEIPERPEIEATTVAVEASGIEEAVPEVPQSEAVSEPEGRPEVEIEAPVETEETVKEAPSEPELGIAEVAEEEEPPSEEIASTYEVTPEVVETAVESTETAEPSVPESGMEEPEVEEEMEMPAERPAEEEEVEGERAAVEEPAEEAEEEIEIDVDEVRKQANAAFEEDDYEKAEELYEQLAMAGENDIDLYYNLGVCYYSNGRLQDAVEVFDAILDADPDDTDSWLTKGAAHFALQEYDKAIDSFNNVLKRNVNEDAAWYYKACSEALRGNAKLALTFLERAISLDENYREIAADDESFASLKDDPKFREIVGEA